MPIQLDSWNVGTIEDTGDYVEAVIGQNLLGNSTVTFRWIEGDTTDDLWTAIGIQQIYYNSDPFAEILAVLENGSDATDDWHLNYGGPTAGGGFGDFISRKSQDGGGTAGIDPNTITLVFDSLVNFVDNGDPTYSTFAVHVRYGEDCSGWASDGNTSNDDSGGSCTTQVPEPGTLALFGLGLFALGLGRRRFRPVLDS